MAITGRGKSRRYAIILFFLSVIVYFFVVSRFVTEKAYLWIGFLILLLILFVFPLVMVQSLIIKKKLISNGVFTDLTLFILFGASLLLFLNKYSKFLSVYHDLFNFLNIFTLPSLYFLLLALIFVVIAFISKAGSMRQ